MGAARRRLLPFKHSLHSPHGATRIWVPESISFHNAATIDEHVELAEPTLDGLNASVRLLAQFGCHTGSHGPFDWSDRAVLNPHLSHGWAPLIFTETDLGFPQFELSLPYEVSHEVMNLASHFASTLPRSSWPHRCGCRSQHQSS